MAVRQTGFALLASSTVQEAMDMALIAHGATLEARMPFLHFFDGFRTSHEIQKIEELTTEDMAAMIDVDACSRASQTRHVARPPVHQGHGPEPRRLFPGPRNRESLLCQMRRHRPEASWTNSPKITGRAVPPFDYVGAPDAEKVIILMGSGCDTVHETVEYLNAKGAKLGVVKVRLFRPFDAHALVAAHAGNA